jgi:uncharacterized protein (TIRG00374 family)
MLIRPRTVFNFANLVRRLIVRFKPSLNDRLAKSIDSLQEWSTEMKEVVSFLWSEKLPVMLVDFVLSLSILYLQAYSLYFVLTSFTGIQLNLLEVSVIYISLNMIANIIPTPGGSGSTESIYSIVFTGLSGLAEPTMVAVIVWRFSTYYLHIAFESLIFFILPFKGKPERPVIVLPAPPTD